MRNVHVFRTFLYIFLFLNFLKKNLINLNLTVAGKIRQVSGTSDFGQYTHQHDVSIIPHGPNSVDLVIHINSKNLPKTFSNLFYVRKIRFYLMPFT